MDNYQSLKVPEIKKLLSERSLPTTGNKADLIARLQENDKEKAPEEPVNEAAKPSAADEDLIDYDDDDFPPKNTTAPTEAVDAPGKDDTEPAATETSSSTAQDGTAKVDAGAGASKETVAEDTTKTDGAAETDNQPTEAPKSAQMLPPTDALSEAEKRAKRAERFGLVKNDGADKEEDSEEAKKLERAEKFGLTNDQVANIDNALPDGPSKKFNKRARGGDDDDGRASKKQSSGANGSQGGASHNAQRNNRRQNRRGGGGAGRNNTGSGPKGGAISLDPAEKKKMEERAKRFAS